MPVRLLLSALVFASAPAWPQVGAGPQPAPPAAAVPAPRDIPFRGRIELRVTATDTVHRVFVVHETIPVQRPGELVLLYPEWETSSHAATASAASLAGLVVQAGGRRLAWHRDPVNVFAFHVDVPRGAASVDVDFQFLSPVTARAGALMLSPELADVAWASLLVYPAGWFARDIPVQATLALPADQQYASALTTTHAGDGPIAFAPVSLERLVDSPVIAGRHHRRVELAAPDAVPVRLDLFADTAAHLEAKDEQLAALRRLVDQAGRLFGARHFRHYDFLATLSDALPAGGLEHLESSEVNLPADFFADPAAQLVNADLAAHEFVHSWNGRFRQPADLWTAAFNEPMRDSLLWVYEGQTQFWGRVLAARAGQRTPQETLDELAIDAAETAHRAGRAWKSLQESSSDSLYMAGRPVTWRDWTRREDYYPEGPLLWLDVDARIRELSGERRGLDDFARAFFGRRDGDLVTATYTFDDICRELNAVAPEDWRAFLRRKLDSHADDDALRGLARAGWRLVYDELASPAFRQNEADLGGADLSYSIGAVVAKNGALRSVRWNASAFRAGLNPGARIVSVDGRPFGADVLEAAIRASATTPIELEVATDAGNETVRLDYRGPLRYPHLERVPGTPDRLGALLAPRAG